MAIGDVLTVKINEVVASGDGLARFGSTAVFASRCCVGETVEVRVYAEGPTWIRAELQKIIGKESPDRVKPKCPFFGRCGGCTMQHLNYEAQLDAKVARFNNKFRHITGFHAPPMRVVASNPWEFLNYMRFIIRKQGRPGSERGVELGFMNIRADEFVPVADCPIAPPPIRAMLAEVAKSHSLLLPPNTDEYLVYSRDDVFLTDMGRRNGRITILDREFVVDVDAFIPSNIPVMEQLIAELVDIADTADHTRPMADLYCGIGTFSAFLADSFPSADLIDENRYGIRLAEVNVPAMNARFITVKDEAWIHDIQPKAGAYGFMVVDPPGRENKWGLSRSVLEWLVTGGPEVLAYRSQDTGTFAHDTQILCRAGYQLSKLTMYDFYPHMGYTDTLAVFVR